MNTPSKTPTLKKPTDIIEFGALQGQSFQQIFRFSITYLEWIIRDTEICFQDLDEFFIYGKPVDIQKISPEKTKKLIENIRKNNKANKNGAKFAHFGNFKSLKISDNLSYSDFIELEYFFPNEIIEANKIKLGYYLNNQSFK